MFDFFRRGRLVKRGLASRKRRRRRSRSELTQNLECSLQVKVFIFALFAGGLAFLVFSGQQAEPTKNYVIALLVLGTAIAQQIGRPLTGGPFMVNLITPGAMYGGGDLYGSRNRNLDLSIKKIIRLGRQRFTAGLDVYNVWNADTTLFYNTAYVQNAAGTGSAIR